MKKKLLKITTHVQKKKKGRKLQNVRISDITNSQIKRRPH